MAYIECNCRDAVEVEYICSLLPKKEMFQYENVTVVIPIS